MIVKTIVAAACLMLSASAFADCTTNARGRTICNNEQQATGTNPNTGNTWNAQKNSSGVTTTESNRGGEARTKEGKGVYRGPGGTTCVKTANNRGCN
jgi:hypothetical protein